MRGLAVVIAVLGLGGCAAAAAGMGAGAAIYVTDRGVESVVAAPIDKTYEAARKAFQEFGITENKTGTEQKDGVETRSLSGKTSDRDVDINLKTEGPGTKVDVVVKKSAVTWDKDFAREILNKIVAEAPKQ
jgi:hypothetical protein